MDWGFGLSSCKLLNLESISNEILLHSTANDIQSLVMEHDEGEREEKNIYICITGSLCCTEIDRNCKSTTIKNLKKA